MKFKPDWFLMGMAGAIGLAWLMPAPGAAGGALHPEFLTKAGIAFIFFLHGLALSFSALKAGALNWRLHLLVQLCTFLVFPLLGILVMTVLGNHVSSALALGFFYLCALPSTVSSSVAMTAAARGNVAGAVFNATLSTLIGVVLTPLWVGWVLKSTGHTMPVGPVMIDLLCWLVLPLVVGHLSRPLFGKFIHQHKSRINVADRLVILLIVYTSFCDSFQRGVWSGNGAVTLLIVLGVAGALFGAAVLITSRTADVLGFVRADRIAAVFCGSKKTLASGVPMAKIIFGSSPTLGLILLPIMIYHPLQLLICGVLARRWEQTESPVPAQDKISSV